MAASDTIAAIATPPGKGGVGIIRLSGPAAVNIAKQLTSKSLKPRHATFSEFADDGRVIDEGVAIYFKAPHSFTGEDVVELQGHGGPIIMDQLLQAVLRLGGRMARPGEFSERAFLNDKLDLTQAEAIADMINATTSQAAQAATRSLQGAFSAEVTVLLDELIRLRMFIESAIDFTDEDIDFIEEHNIIAALNNLLTQIKKVQDSAQQGALLQSGINVVITGEPNAGKSSLLNRLSGRDSAIVTDIAGTTRDVLKESISIDGMPLHIIDTAGLRETSCLIEQEGVKRAHHEISKADLILWIYDATRSPEICFDFPEGIPIVKVKNKIDLLDHIDLEANTIAVSVKDNLNIDGLKQAIKQRVGFHTSEGSIFSARRRHLDALAQTCEHIQQGLKDYQQAAAHELLAENLRLASLSLGEITGKFTSDDLLGKIFAEFCIGK